MCGIAGYVGARPLAEERVQDCLARMVRRGPDDRASRAFKTPAGAHAVLLNSRLKVVDLQDRSNQPMERGGRWLTYNGELYNYVELRRDLHAEGVHFTTSSDTEVLLQALVHWGWSALDRCEGMWAFALYDERDGSLHLCRDRFGEKPLYFHRFEHGFVFASEPKCVAALLGRSLNVNRNHVVRYLVHGYKALYKGAETFFEGLSELPPATTLHLDASGNEVGRDRYWALHYKPDEQLDRHDAIEGTRDRLIRAVELRLRADVPLAFCLSGGVDSTALTSVAKRVCRFDVHGFTIVNDDPRYDERDVVLPAVAQLGIRHTAMPLETCSFLRRLREAVRYHDAPVYTIAYFVHWRLMQAIAEAGYRISVSGTAADELLSGYYDHHLAYLAAVRHDRPAYEEAFAAWKARVLPHVRNPHLRDPDLFVNHPDFRGHIYFDTERFESTLLSPWHEAFAEASYTTSLLRNRMLNELFHENVPVILHEDDLNAMYYSVENRSPYLDRQLAEFCYTIPTPFLVRDGFAKAILRDAVRGIAPDVALDSPRKVGFNAPIFSLLDPADAAVRQELLADSPIFDLVRRESIEVLLDPAKTLPNSLSKFLFSFTSAKVFLEEFA